MKDFSRLLPKVTLIFLSSSLCACIVAPKKVASYDAQCRVSTQKIELTVEQIEVFDAANCLVHSCTQEIINALAISTLAITTSAVVSGSIALAGNTVYWLESQGECPNLNQKEQPPKTPQEKPNEEYLITEEVIAAKS
jgi:hypothetical protein